MENLMNQISALIAIVVFIGLVVFKIVKKQKILLSDIVIAVIAGGMLPIALAFVLFPFFPQSIKSIESISLQITLTGLILIFVYVKTIIERINKS